MKAIKTNLPGVIILEPRVFHDNRGWFYESFSDAKLPTEMEGISFVQDGHSYSACLGTLRGLHYQCKPHAQAKLVRCTRGAVLDIAVDIRKGSPSYAKWLAVELSEDNFRQIFIPKGFAHGFVTLTDDAEIQYKTSDYYAPDCDRSIRFDDPEIAVKWFFENPIISDRDRNAPTLADSDNNFVYGEI